MAAIKGQIPVVPAAISGTREMLASDDWMLRFSRPAIRLLPPLTPEHPAFTNHKQLAEAARDNILAELDEPDLLDSSPARVGP